MTIDSPIFVVSASGITAPTYDEILEYFKDKAKSIFGSDINLDADTQDGQLLAIFSAAINDLNAQAISVFNAYNPNTASGVALDCAVKTNGLTRHDASRSQVDLKLVGVAGTVINNGVAIDSSDNRWLLPSPGGIASQILLQRLKALTLSLTWHSESASPCRPCSQPLDSGKG